MSGLDKLPTLRFELSLGMPTAGVTTDTLDLSNGTAVGLMIATPWAGTLATVYVPDTAGTLRPAYDTAGNALTVVTAAERYVSLDPDTWAGIGQFALVSNATEDALATISVHTRAR